MLQIEFSRYLLKKNKAIGVLFVTPTALKPFDSVRVTPNKPHTVLEQQQFQ